MEEHVKKSIASSTALIMVLTFVGYMLGLVTQITIAKYFGAAAELDAFVAASLMPEFIFGITNAIFFTSFVVLYPEYIKKKGDAAGKEFIGKVFTFACIFLSLIILILVFFSPLIAKAIAPGFSVEQVALTSIMIKILAVAVFFFGLSSLLTGILYYEHTFFAPKMLRCILSLCLIFTLLLFQEKIGIISLAIGTIVGIVIAYFIQYWTLRNRGYYFPFVIDVRDSSLRELLIVSWPLLMSSLLYYLSRTIANIIASTFGQGSVSVLNYAFLIITLPVIFFSGSVTASVFPHMTKQSADDKREEIGILFMKALRMLLGVMIPLTFVFMILGTEIVKLLFERGEFTSAVTAQVSHALFFFAIGLVPSGVWGVILNVFYAMKKMKAQMWIYLFFLMTNVMFNFILVKFISYNGIALGFSLAYWVSTLLAFYYITKKLKSFDYKELMKSSVKITIASLAMGVCILFLKKRIPEMLIWLMPEISSFILQGEALLLIGIIGALVYVVILKVVKTEEVTIFFSAMKKM